MTTELEFADLVAPVRDLGQGDGLQSWRWLVGDEARPLLLTALGDMFAELPGGEVALLDTYEGTFKVVAADRASWKDSLRRNENVDAWFTPGLVEALRERGLILAEGQCYSPDHPLILGGTMEPENFAAYDWRVHLGITGQIYQQSVDLPEGTPITGFTWQKD